METIKLNGKLTMDEKETLLNYDPVTDTWIMDSTIQKHFRKAIKQGWTPIKQFVSDDGNVCAMVLSAPGGRSVTFRSVEKKKLSEKQLINLNKSE